MLKRIGLLSVSLANFAGALLPVKLIYITLGGNISIGRRAFFANHCDIHTNISLTAVIIFNKQLKIFLLFTKNYIKSRE